MARRKSAGRRGQLSVLEPRTRTAPCVPTIREAVAEWRSGNYLDGVTSTTRTLLNYWFRNDHRLPSGTAFRFYDAQREAIETLIYLYEVARVRQYRELIQTYAPSLPGLPLLRYDDFARYCIKMATGSGKTKVMALAIAWQYFNAVVEGMDDYAKTFLMIAPNVIVFERLRTDFAGGRIFRTDPIIPREFSIYWDFDCYMRGEQKRAHSLGAVYVTNIQQFYERDEEAGDNEPQPMTDVLGSRPPAQLVETEDFDRQIAARGGACVVLNDEAHHTHDEESEWNKVIRRFHQDAGGHVVAQLDFSATPRFSKGALFTWTVFDYPLKQAIIDNIVKRPVKGIASGIRERPSSIASVRYATYLTAGVERWREYRDQLAALSKKPILFVMLNSTQEADDVGDYLRTKYPSDFAGEKLLVIHTDRKGEVSKRDLDKARRVAREVDQEANSVNAIVSVLMLREGWDVQSVVVVVGLRPYTARANILPEQTIGRGLRLMFREASTARVERVDVIGNKAFIQFVEELEQEEEMQLETFEVGKDKLAILTIRPDPAKMDRDIAVPMLSPILARKKALADEIAALDLTNLSFPILPRRENDAAAQTFQYEGYDFITLQKILERQYTIPEPQTAQEVISYYTKRIAQEIKLPSQFASLAPKVREFLETRAFGQKVDLEDPTIIKAISSNVAQYVTVKTFVQALRALVVEQLEPTLLNKGRKLSETPPFPWSRGATDATRTVFTLVACDNEFEKRFARFLEDASDVAAFAKLPEQFGFGIEYTDASGNLRYYEPDFVVVLKDGAHYLVETKGREDLDVAHKDRAAQIWCENATLLTDTGWAYVKVPQREFERLEPSEFSDLTVLGAPQTRQLTEGR